MDSTEIELSDRKIRDAYARHLAGASWHDIAEEFGYANAGSAQVSVSRYIQRTAYRLDQAEREAMLRVELDRLDALQRAVWPSAMTGDAKGVEAALKVMDRRHRLLGFNKPDERVSNQTLIVPADRFVETLKEAIEERDAAKPTQVSSLSP